MAENRKMLLSDLVISFNEKYDDYVIYSPWNPKEYVVAVGSRALGFGEKNYLGNTLKKIGVDYGQEIPVGLIETKVIPEVSEPLVRRHGSDDTAGHLALDPEAYTVIGKWIAYQDDKMPEALVIQSDEPELPHQKILELEIGRPMDPNGKYVKGLYLFFLEVGRTGIMVTQAHGFNYDDFKTVIEHGKDMQLMSTRTNKDNSLQTFISKAKKRIRVRVINKPELKAMDAYTNTTAPFAVDWNMFTGDENSNRNLNDSERWSPMHQDIKSR